MKGSERGRDQGREHDQDQDQDEGRGHAQGRGKDQRAPRAEAPARAVSMTDVAREVGVSLKTVSRVVNEPERVRPATRARVEEAMERMGFRASFAGRTLKTGRYRCVGLAMLTLYGGNAAVFEGIAGAAAEAGYALTLIKAREDEDLTLAEIARRMSSLPVDGIIVNLNRAVPDFETYRSPAGLNTVLICPEPHPTCTTVSDDQEGCTRMATARLLELGHRTVWYVGGPAWSLAARAREAGWRRALAEAGAARVPEPLAGDWTADCGYELGAHLAAEPACTAVVCANDAMANGVVAALRDAGRSVPGEVSVVGVDDALAGLVPHVGLSTVRFRHEELGARAFAEAVAGLEAAPGGDAAGAAGAGGAAVGQGAAPRHLLIPGELIERGSIAPPR